MIKNKEKAFFIIFSILLYIVSVSVKTEAAEQNNSTTYTITFKAMGGTFDDTTANVTDIYGELPVPTKEYYTFKGWYTFPSGGAKITQGNKVKIPRNHTLYAQWTGNPYTLTLDANGGKVSKETVTVYYGTKYLNQLPTPSRENYVFDGWYTTAKAGVKVKASTVFDETARKKLYAHWTPKKLTITLIAYNGDSYELEVTCGKKYGKLPKPVREGFKFGGWFTWEDFAKVEAEAVPENKVAAETDPLMLFARWY